ncbi:MAG TPA: phage holin family protein [Terriglobales bacterium]|nr:phage holin family protein [Terriglobales bacterium]
MNGDARNGRSLPTLAVELLEELNEFASTRVKLLACELQEKGKIVKAAVPLAATAVLFLTTAFLAATAALVTLLAMIFPGNPFRWFFALLMVSVCWLLFGGVAAYLAKRAFTSEELLPRKTLDVLKADNHWLQREAKDYLWAHPQ